MSSTTEYYIAELGRPVEILIDTWGIPHIYAESDHDLYVAQGFNAARDRLFQIDLWRRRGLGRLAEVLGDAYLDQDHANRLFLYRGDIAAEWDSYGPTAKDVVTAFTTGINAYIAWASADHSRLPPEFHRHSYTPQPWHPEDVVRIRTHGLFMNVEAEVARALMIRDAGEDAERVRQTREPNDPYRIPHNQVLDLITDDVLSLYRLAFIPVGFPDQPTPQQAGNAGDGSNNWAVAPTRSATGRPILASDPHRALTLPSLRYIAHLESPTTSLIGAGEPAVPGITIGHNGKVAFSLTIGCADQEDLYIYELDPDRPTHYRYQGQWEPFTTTAEEIGTTNSGPHSVELTFSRHGPIIHHDPERGFAIGLRAAWLEPGMAPYMGSLRYANSTNVEEFRDALRHWGAPTANQVFADTTGDIAWQHAARVPKRPNWDGDLPVPGSGEFEWSGFADIDELPHTLNPETGWFTSSNEMNLPAEYDNQALTITYDWASPARHRRLVEWLESNQLISIEDCIAMQFDTNTIEGRDFAKELSAIDAEAIKERALFERLQHWDGDASVDSLEAVVFEIWVRRHLRPWLIEAYFAPDDRSPKASRRIRAIGTRDESFFSDLRGDRTMLRAVAAAMPSLQLMAAIDATFNAAVAEVEELLGSDRSRWRWGALLHCHLENPALAGALDTPGHSVGPRPRGGTGDTVQLATYDRDFKMIGGSTFRVVVDVGAWDNSRAVNAPGQSGDPRSPHYDDLFIPWCSGDTFPLSYSRAAVQDCVEKRIALLPKSPEGF